MTQAIPSQKQTFFIPYTEYSITVDKTHLCVTRCILTGVVLAGIGVALSSISQYRLPDWAYGIDGVATVIAGGGLVTTFFFKDDPPEKQPLMPLKLSLHIPPPIVNVSADHMKLIDELCEVKETCNVARAKQIVEQLKEEGRLAALNAIPVIHDPSLGPDVYTHETALTPLQHWASQGNLEMCKLLVEHGALDYCGDKNNTTALYEAAFAGHMPLVEYLMQEGAHPNLAFQTNPLFYFIPKFAFEMIMCKSHTEYQPCFECFEFILDFHSKQHPDNLAYQLKIPVDEKGANVLGWLKKMEQIRVHHQGPMIGELQEILTGYGAIEDSVLTIDELTQTGMDVGHAITLYELASLK